MDSFNKLAELFRQFPGIGPRQAKRFVYFLLTKDKNYFQELTSLFGKLKDEIRQCESCFRYFQSRNGTLCSICADKSRDSSILMVVAKDTDLEAMEKSGSFRGRYFVLGGTIPLLEKKSADPVRIKELLSLLNLRSSASDNQRESASLKEVILALNANPDGEHTADVLRSELSTVASTKGIKISILGRGLSTGSELEYADSETIKSALKNRA